MANEIRALLFDIDGSIMLQGGPIDPRVGAIFRELRKIGLPCGPATGKNADYARGLGVGIGLQWNHISAESGAQFLRLVTDKPVPVWEQKANLKIGLEHLILFRETIQLDTLARNFLLKNTRVRYRPELKEGIITLFPSGENIKESEEWLVFFKAVVSNFNLDLTLKRHSDGCIDVVPIGIDKRLGVMEVCRLYGCEPTEILTVVDGTNDDELATGTTVIAVANAVEKIKTIASNQGGFLATLPDGLGFAQGLIHYSEIGRLPQALAAIIGQLIPEIIGKAET